MKPGIFLLTIGVLALASSLPAQNKGFEQWVGLWQGMLDNQPGVTVTLGRDTGDLQGTIVFNVVARENGEAHVIGHDAHVLTHVNVNDGTLAFHVIRLGDSLELHLTMKLTADNHAVLECADCGGPPATDLARIH